MKLAVAASPEVAIPTLEYLLSSEHELALIISRPDSVSGRGRELTPTPVASWANQHDIALYCPMSANDFDKRLQEFDLVITIGYGLILPEFLLTQPKHGFINLHFSLLPLLRGAAPVQRAIINGFNQTGVTVFKLDRGMDTGPIYVTCPAEIAITDTAGSLLEKLAALGPAVISETLQKISTNYTPQPQDGSLATFAPKLSKSEGRIIWNRSATEIVHQILGFSPNPGATSLYRGEILRITSARALLDQLAVGEIRLVANSVLVGTKSGAVELIEVTPAGKRVMGALDWARGARFEQGETLE